MPRGGSRNRSGPAPDPGSLRSAGRDFTTIALPREGYAGEPPTFPLPAPTERELEVWREAWSTPQAAAWIQEPWRHRTVGQWVRWSVRMESPAAGASLGAVVVRLADQIGLTPAGLRENGWKVARDELGERRDGEPDASPAKAPRSTGSSRDRLTVVDVAAGD